MHLSRLLCGFKLFFLSLSITAHSCTPPPPPPLSSIYLWELKGSLNRLIIYFFLSLRYFFWFTCQTLRGYSISLRDWESNGVWVLDAFIQGIFFFFFCEYFTLGIKSLQTHYNATIPLFSVCVYMHVKKFNRLKHITWNYTRV